MAARTGLASLLLRGILGSTMIAHGVRHGRTLAGTARWFGGIGFQHPDLQARLSVAVEVGSGAALLSGAGTPLAGSAVVGTMAVAARTVHIENGYFVIEEGYEYVLALAGAATALAALGAGPLSIDRASGLEARLSGARAILLTLGLGLAAAAAQLKVFWRKPVRAGS